MNAPQRHRMRAPGARREVILAERQTGSDGCVLLELEGELTGDRNLDADAGALLIRPTRVVDVGPFDTRRVEELEERLRSHHPSA